MTKEYNQWYWKIYRWFKWDAKHFHRDVAQGFRNLWKWFPIIWKDRDWDDHFIFEVLKFKIKNTADLFEKNQRFVGWENEVKYMRICQSLIDKIQNEYYKMEHYDFYEFELNFVPTENNMYEMKSTTTRDDCYTYVSKYPRTKKIVLSNPHYNPLTKRGDKGIALAMGIERHNRARKLLFKILEQRIERWWD